MSSETPGGAPTSERERAAPLDNAFLVCTVAFLRAKQLAAGARPRVEPAGHKPAHLAVLEVVADAVSWSTV